MSEKRFKLGDLKIGAYREIIDTETGNEYECVFSCKIMNEQQATISQLEEEKDYWKSKAMTLLMQVLRLTSRMTDKEVKEFNKELEE